MKKFLCMFVLCAMLLSLLPTVVVAEDASAVLQGEALAIESVISDGTVWTYEDLTYPSLWLGDGSTVVQVSSSVYTKVDTKGIGVAARLATPSTLTGFVLTLDGTAGKESWKSRMNTVKLYASVDGTDWTEVGAVSGVTDGQSELTVSVASTDTTTVYHFVAFYQPESVGSFRFCGIKAYGDPVAMPRLYGSQISTVYTKDGADYYSIRFVSTVDTVDLDHVGYRISVLDSTQKIVRQYTTQVTKVYTAINGGNGLYDAATLGGKYIQTLVIRDVPVAMGELTFVVTPTSYHKTGTTVGKSGAITYAASGGEISLTQSNWLTGQTVRVNDATLEGYRIVYSAGNAEAGADYAALLIENIKAATGITLTAVSDVASATGKEILLGATNRGTHESLDFLNCKVAIANGKIQISAGGAFSLRYAAMNFVSLLESDLAGTVNVFNGYTATKSLEEDSERPLTEGASLRIMSANILAKRYHEYHGSMPQYRFPERVEIFMAMLDFYAPDVVGLQEADDWWTTYLEELVSNSNGKWGLIGVSDYASDGTDNANIDNENWSTILYRKDKLDVVASGIEDYSHYKAKRAVCYRMTWAILKLKETQVNFGIVNTHWTPGNETNLLAESLETVALMEKLEKEYTCAMLSTADYNSGEATTQYKNIHSKYPDAKFSAKTLVNSIGSWHNYATPTPSYNSCDHIFAGEHVNTLAFRTLMHNQQIYASDHAWLYADVLIRQKLQVEDDTDASWGPLVPVKP